PIVGQVLQQVLAGGRPLIQGNAVPHLHHGDFLQQGGQMVGHLHAHQAAAHHNAASAGVDGT
ncbi:hypothetical protein PKCEKB_PKCEKB_06925, partial [Dysosmobacter welbionis]